MAKDINTCLADLVLNPSRGCQNFISVKAGLCRNWGVACASFYGIL